MNSWWCLCYYAGSQLVNRPLQQKYPLQLYCFQIYTCTPETVRYCLTKNLLLKLDTSLKIQLGTTNYLIALISFSAQVSYDHFKNILLHK
jgi:hypothetical protein